MVSVLIPVFNYDIGLLAEQISVQLVALKGAEIIICDDGSDMKFRTQNRLHSEKFGVKYVQNEINIGRSSTRNRLADEACNDILIFLDSDICVQNRNFVVQYLENSSTAEIIFGGIAYSDAPPDEPELFLRWFYGKRREEIAAYERSKQANRLFMTGNFCIKKSVFNKVRFNEQLRTYGHEDTLFAYELAASGFRVLHIENPALHIGLEPCDIFLRKTVAAIDNMLKINQMQKNSLMLDTIRLWRTYQKLKPLHFALRLFWRMLKRMIEHNLCSKRPKFVLFDLYKLFALAYFDKKNRIKTAK